MAPQRFEKIESAPGNGMVSEAANPQDPIQGRAADRARLRLTPQGRSAVVTADPRGRRGNFPGCKLLKSHETAKESRRPGGFRKPHPWPLPARTPEDGEGNSL